MGLELVVKVEAVGVIPDGDGVEEHQYHGIKCLRKCAPGNDTTSFVRKEQRQQRGGYE